jgi:hypothetical protein
VAAPDELEGLAALLPAGELGLPPRNVAERWRAWQQQHALNVGVIERRTNGAAEVVGLGVTAWLSSTGLAEVLKGSDVTLSARLYAHDTWPVLTYPQLCEAHRAQTLTLAVLHFWSALRRGDEGFIELLMHGHQALRELHEGFGIAGLYVEALDDAVVVLAQAGLWPVLPRRAGRTMMGLQRDEALHSPGSTMSFLFLAPAARLALPGPCQRMVTLALRQLTDEGIAAQLKCTRDHVRGLWEKVYDALEAVGALPIGAGQARGPERRRLALEFFRTHPQELRPGLPAR